MALGSKTFAAVVHSCCVAQCIAYLLRRRRHDDEYMDPSGTFAGNVKALLEDTEGMEKKKTIQCMGGFVDLPRVTRIIIEYIARRGRDRLVLIE